MQPNYIEYPIGMAPGRDERELNRKLQSWLEAINAGATLFIQTPLRTTYINRRVIARFAKVKLEVLKVAGPSMYLRRGNHWDCISHCKITLVENY